MGRVGKDPIDGGASRYSLGRIGDVYVEDLRGATVLHTILIEVRVVDEAEVRATGASFRIEGSCNGEDPIPGAICLQRLGSQRDGVADFGFKLLEQRRSHQHAGAVCAHRVEILLIDDEAGSRAEEQVGQGCQCRNAFVRRGVPVDGPEIGPRCDFPDPGNALDLRHRRDGHHSAAAHEGVRHQEVAMRIRNRLCESCVDPLEQAKQQERDDDTRRCESRAYRSSP